MYEITKKSSIASVNESFPEAYAKPIVEIHIKEKLTYIQKTVCLKLKKIVCSQKFFIPQNPVSIEIISKNTGFIEYNAKFK